MTRRRPPTRILARRAISTRPRAAAAPRAVAIAGAGAAEIRRAGPRRTEG